MSYNTFPTLQGVGWPIKVSPRFKTVVHEAASGATFTTALMQYPVFDFELPINYLSQADFATLEAFFVQQQGGAIPFYLNIINDDTVASVDNFAVGNGTTTVFTIQRHISGSVAVPIDSVAPTPAPVGYVANVPASATFNGNQVTFATPPAASAFVGWTGGYLYLVRFAADTNEFSQIMSQIYESKAIKFRGYR